ncbi:Ger(x)C family spore germination protein [Clostridium paraputrificum]|uniref:Ger(x)C family spore germination protein n=1 Tax=Clostridium TaxID=1485 RepID=UPI003D354F72
MGKRVASFLGIICLSFSMISCFNYTEINKVTFATSIIFDRDEYDNVILYLDCVRPYRNANDSSDKGKRIIFEGRGKTSLEALRDMDVASSNKLDFSQVRAYIFTEQAARNGIKKYIDIINNDQQFGFKPYMFVYFGEVKPLLDVTSSDEEYLGLYLDELVNKNKENGKVISSNVNDYISDSLIGNNLSFMSAIELKKDSIEQKIELKGGVIMKDNHMVEALEQKDVLSYNLLENKVREGTFEVQNPDENDKLITLDILEHYTKTNIEKVDDGFKLKKNIELKVSIGEIQGKLKVNKEIMDTIERTEGEKLERYLESFYKEYQEKGIDILGVVKLVNEKLPNSNVKDILGNTELNVTIDITIDGSSLVRDSL